MFGYLRASRGGRYPLCSVRNGQQALYLAIAKCKEPTICVNFNYIELAVKGVLFMPYKNFQRFRVRWRLGKCPIAILELLR